RAAGAGATVAGGRIRRPGAGEAGIRVRPAGCSAGVRAAGTRVPLESSYVSCVWWDVPDDCVVRPVLHRGRLTKAAAGPRPQGTRTTAGCAGPRRRGCRPGP